jgi:hypothetical protein
MTIGKQSKIEYKQDADARNYELRPVEGTSIEGYSEEIHVDELAEEEAERKAAEEEAERKAAEEEAARAAAEEGEKE